VLAALTDIRSRCFYNQGGGELSCQTERLSEVKDSLSV